MTDAEGDARGALIDRLRHSAEPAIRYRAAILTGRAGGGNRGVLSADAVASLREEIRQSDRAATLLSARKSDGRLQTTGHVYRKFIGAHWVLVDLADLGYPPGDRDLYRMRDQVYDQWLQPRYHASFEYSQRPQANERKGVPHANDRYRRCGSQHGNALYASIALGIADERAHELVRLLLKWQWPDGGWNCDTRLEARISSFHETVTPLRGLAAYAKWNGARPALADEAQDAARRAAEIFLSRRLYRRLSTGTVIHPSFLQFAYPRYWHYDLLAGLLAMMDVDALGDPRCADALDLVEKAELPEGGWPSGRRYYRTVPVSGDPAGSNISRVGWGPHGRKQMNEWVTTDILAVLASAGR